jgi:hypothetical protein
MSSYAPPELPPYVYGGARALVLLHDRHLREFFDTWREARTAGVVLPETSDRAYASMGALLRHGLGAARGYMVWMCEQLELPDPGIEMYPDAEAMEASGEEYLEHVLKGWIRPLAGITEEQCERPEYKSRWGTLYCIDAMLEHAVMHPIRHGFQLQNLMNQGKSR